MNNNKLYCFNFPFYTDDVGLYLFDSNNNIVCDNTSDEIEDNTLMQSIADKINGKTNKIFDCHYDERYQLILDKDNNELCRLRGWGLLRNTYGELNAMKIQNAIGKFIVNKLNENRNE